MSQVLTLPDGRRQSSEQMLEPWTKRRDAARKARRPFEGQWMTNQAFAAGRQWVVYLDREHRIQDDPRPKLDGRAMETADVLTQYLWTVIGKLAGDDFRPEFLTGQRGPEAQSFADGANTSFGWGWDEEWRADERILDLLHTLVVFGSGGIRCRYDRSRGPLIGDVPHVVEQSGYTHDFGGGKTEMFGQGKPILDPTAARAYVADRKQYGEPTGLKQLREGSVVWDVLSPWNLLPPPAVEDPDEFPWEILVRPVALETLRSVYGDSAQDVVEDGAEAMAVLGLRDNMAQGGQGASSSSKLDDHALVYTGYKRPDADFPKGATVTWANDEHVLDARAELPYNTPPRGARSGLTYFRYWPVKQRFWGRALIEPGIGPQRTRNKRRSQQSDLIDRGMPKIITEEGALPDTDGSPLEIVELKPGTPMPVVQQGINPGPWMQQDLEQCDVDIQQALGQRQVALGSQPTGVTAYAAMSLLSENDATKLDPISKHIRLGVARVATDTIESMRQWPDGKQMAIIGDDDKVESFTFRRSMIPATYLARPATGSALPRSQAAEIQKITDLANFSTTIGQPLPLDWYKRSLDAGKAEDLPKNLGHEQARAAELENAVMVHTGQPVPVAPYDDANVHVPAHESQAMELQAALERGDTTIAPALQAILAHLAAHMQAQQAQQQQQQQLPPGPPAPPQAG